MYIFQTIIFSWLNDIRIKNQIIFWILRNGKFDRKTSNLEFINLTWPPLPFCLLLLIWPLKIRQKTCCSHRADFCLIFRSFCGNGVSRKNAFDIYWPLTHVEVKAMRRSGWILNIQQNIEITFVSFQEKQTIIVFTLLFYRLQCMTYIYGKVLSQKIS